MTGGFIVQRMNNLPGAMPSKRKKALAGARALSFRGNAACAASATKAREMGALPGVYSDFDAAADIFFLAKVSILRASVKSGDSFTAIAATRATLSHFFQSM